MNCFRKTILALVACMTCSFCVSAQTDETQLIEVNLESPGSLGVEVLYKVNVLDDVTNLKVSGSLNDNDWTTLRNMTNLEYLDLSEATAAYIPANNFQNRSSLSTFIAPVGITSIGQYAFSGSGVKEITIPESVTGYGSNMFYNCKALERVVINAAASLPNYAFSNCKKLEEVRINGDIPVIGNDCFYSCEALQTINFPESLVEIGSQAFQYNINLSDVVFPENLQKIGSRGFQQTGIVSVTLPFSVTLGDYAFSDSDNLEEVTLPGIQFEYTNQFFNCINIHQITCPAGTPPAINGNNDPFRYVSKGDTKLIVPTFSMVNYKLDTYWMQFGTIEGGVLSDRWVINSELSMTNNRRFEGKPALDLYPNGKLTVGGAAPMDLSSIRFHNERDIYGNGAFVYAQLINNCPAMTAASASVELECYGGQWYYISMPCNVKMSNVHHSAGSDYVFRYYDGESRATNGAGSSWKDVPEDGVLEAGKGYIYQSYSQGNIVLTADAEEAAELLAAGDKATAVTAWSAENQADAGWNLIGNPFMSYYDLSESTLSCPVTLWDSSRRVYTAYSLIDDVVVLAPMQAFFIQQSDADGEITFGSDGRSFNAVVSGAPSHMTAPDSRSIFDIIVTKDNSSSWNDRTRLVVNPDAALGYESNCDASKFFADNTDLPSLYTIDASGNRLAINERPADNGVVQLGVYVPAPGTFTLAALRAEGKLTLCDLLADREIDLSSGESYQFTVEESGLIDQRFNLVVATNDGTYVDSVCGGETAFNVSPGFSEIVVNGQHGAKVTVYTTDGRIVAEDVIATEECRLKAAAGLYIVTCNGNAVKCVVK